MTADRVLALDAGNETQYIRAVGGTTWHWAAACWRFLPNDFRINTLYGVGRDWPIGYEDLEPFYQQAEVMMGVAGPRRDEEDLGSPRSAEYPMPKLPWSYMDQLFGRILNTQEFRVVTEPVSRNSVTYDNRPACCGNNNCMPICPIAAQYSGAMSVTKAERLGAQLIENAVVHRLETDAEGSRITAVHYKRPDGSEHRLAADRVVLAAHGIETPKLMLMSRNDAAPEGIGNRTDQVGRYLTDHPGTGVTFLWDQRVYPGRGPQEMTSVVNFRDGSFRAEFAAKKLHLGNIADLEGVVDDLISEGRRGPELDRLIRDRVTRKVSINSFHEQLALPENRVIPSPRQTDVRSVRFAKRETEVDFQKQAGTDRSIIEGLGPFPIAEIPQVPNYVGIDPDRQRRRWHHWIEERKSLLRSATMPPRTSTTASSALWKPSCHLNRRRVHPPWLVR